jgi:hypothetical protein
MARTEREGRGLVKRPSRRALQAQGGPDGDEVTKETVEIIRLKVDGMLQIVRELKFVLLGLTGTNVFFIGLAVAGICTSDGFLTKAAIIGLSGAATGTSLAVRQILVLVKEGKK